MININGDKEQSDEITETHIPAILAPYVEKLSSSDKEVLDSICRTLCCDAYLVTAHSLLTRLNSIFKRFPKQLDDDVRLAEWFSLTTSYVKWASENKPLKPLSTHIPSKYKLAEAFLKYTIRYEAQFDSILLLFIKGLISSDLPSNNLYTIADEIRKSAITSNQRNAVLGKIPFIENEQNFGDYLNNLVVSLSEIQTNNNIQRIFINKILLLVGSLSSEIEEQANTADHQPVNLPPHNNIYETDDADSLDRSPSKVGAIHLIPPKLSSDFEPVEDDISNVLLPADTDDTEENLSDQGLEAEARYSSFWISNHANRTSSHISNLTSIEKRKLVREIMAAILSEDQKLTSYALLTGISYSTGRNIREIATTRIGESELLTPEGVFQIELIRPDQYFQPDDTQRELYTPLIEEPLLFLLPHPLQSHLKTMIYRSHGKTLISIFDTSKEILIGETLEWLETLRDKSRYRLTEAKIKNALRNTLDFKYDNALLSFIFTAGKNDAPPMSAYYAAISRERLQEVYREITHILWGDVGG